MNLPTSGTQLICHNSEYFFPARTKAPASHLLTTVMLCAALSSPSSLLAGDDAHSGGKEVAEIGSQRELFVDDWLIDALDGAQLKLHHPRPEEIAVTFDAPAEGNVSAYVTVFQDGDIYRMYYRGGNYNWETRKTSHEATCYAESRDGRNWSKPALGLFELNGSKQNNIVWMGAGTHNFAPFKDANPDCRHDEAYKALGGDSKGLIAFASADGIHWRQLRAEPVITKGAFDSQNLAFWDTVRQRYVDFHRGFRDGVRGIMTAHSPDFLDWTEPQFIDMGDVEPMHLYTNATVAYARAPHIFLAFPKRFVESRAPAYHPHPDHNYPGVSDGLLMSSRDGLHWHRWDEAFIRPGENVDRWWQRNNMTAWGIVETKSDLPGQPPELSLYSSENYYVGPGRLRRFSLRLDGFASINAPYKGGYVVTRPLVFAGKELEINFATSAAGSIRCELQDERGKPIPGFALEECAEIYGDRVEHVVHWEQGSSVESLAGKPVRLKIALKDADVYSLRFRP